MINITIDGADSVGNRVHQEYSCHGLIVSAINKSMETARVMTSTAGDASDMPIMLQDIFEAIKQDEDYDEGTKLALFLFAMTAVSKLSPDAMEIFIRKHGGQHGEPE